MRQTLHYDYGAFRATYRMGRHWGIQGGSCLNGFEWMTVKIKKEV